MSQFKDLGKKIAASIPNLEIIAANAEIVANEDALGAISQRIFVDGKNADGTDIGQYAGENSKSKGRYKAKRNAAGRRIDKVDLQFNGNLFNSLQLGTLNGKPAVGIISPKQADIADHNEKRFGIVFQATEQEKDNAIELARAFMFDGIKKEMKKWS
jgi:hypothetical protein